ncbi:MAG: formyltransferase family protein [Planctomycetota bacterium]
MRVVLFGRRTIALDALDLLLARGHDVLPVVPRKAEPEWARQPTFADGVRDRGLGSCTLRDVPAHPFVTSAPVDLLISFYFAERIRQPVLDLARVAAVNFHPAPLPEYGGIGGYNLAILHDRREFGVTAHHMDETIDTGDIILRHTFAIDAPRLTGHDLEAITRDHMLPLFTAFVDLAESGEPWPRVPQPQPRYTTWAAFEQMKLIDPARATPEEVDRHARAFWYPPYDGACIQVGDERFTLVPRCVLDRMR